MAWNPTTISLTLKDDGYSSDPKSAACSFGLEKGWLFDWFLNGMPFIWVKGNDYSKLKGDAYSVGLEGDAYFHRAESDNDYPAIVECDAYSTGLWKMIAVACLPWPFAYLYILVP